MGGNGFNYDERRKLTTNQVDTFELYHRYYYYTYYVINRPKIGFGLNQTHLYFIRSNARYCFK